MSNTNNKKPAPVSEPIAIVGFGCRFPGGADNPEAFWNLLREGVDAITEVPADRWNADAFYSPDISQPGTAVTRWGGFVRQRVTDFDAGFFGMAPREAAHLDPMQRWLLEVSWEALEDAGIPHERLAGTPTGVFVGVFTEDTKLFQLGEDNRDLIGSHTGTGTAMTMAANRISYWFDFRGPSIALDTACSSSLIAVHLACQSLWSGESTLALAGGANAMFRPEFTIAESKAGMLSPDGRCKTFDASANGYVRGEGAGMVVLKPLADALRDGDRVHAVILGTASNQDGRTQGITVPSGAAQEALMLDAFRRAGVSPGRVRYMEAHGTGTPVGDPIEVKALGAVLSLDRVPGDRCLVSSVKTNIGHLEAAAGVAGLIKAALCLERREVPPHLHLTRPNPAIPFDELGLRVPLELESWPDEPGPALAAVNSFGFGGANAHVVLAAAAGEDTAPSQETGRAELVPLSARSPEALRALARSYTNWLADGPGSPPPAAFPDIAWTASVRRTHHNHRLTVVAQDKEELRGHLEAFLRDEESPGLRHGLAGRGRRLAWVFSGMGPQWWGMGRQLLDEEPVFREMIERCDELFRHLASWSLLDEMTAGEERSRMGETQISQPANFALQAGLVSLLRSWGVEPDAIVGHSTGEAAAFWAAGVVSLEEATRISFHRSRLQHRTTGQGKLVAVDLPLEEARQAIAGFDGVSIAAVNSPFSVTLAGDPAVLEAVVAPLQAHGVFCRFLRVDVPFHSHYMDPLRAELEECLAGLELHPARVPLYSTVTAARAAGPELDAAYWWRNVREPVYFAAAMDRLIEDGYDAFLEIGPHPVLTAAMTDCLRQRSRDGVLLLSTLRRKAGEREGLLDTLGGLYTAGRPVAWQALHPEPRRVADLPLYPWQRERHWDESPESVRDRLEGAVHPLLGKRLSAARPEWQVKLGRRSTPYLQDHQVHGGVVYPGAAFIEMGVAAVREMVGEASSLELEEVRFDRAMFLPEGELRVVQTLFDSEDLRFQVFSRPLDGKAWVRHSHGRLFRARRSSRPRPAALAELDQVRERMERRMEREIPREECYARLAAKGFHYGPYFQGLDRVWLGGNESLARLSVLPAAAEIGSYHVHPTVLDAGFQSLLLAALAASANDSTFMPVAIERVVVHGRPGIEGWAHSRITRLGDRVIEGDIRIFDEAGNLVMEIQGGRIAALEAGTGVDEPLDRLMFEVEWQPLAAAAGTAAQEPAGTWLFFADRGGVALSLAARLEGEGETCATVVAGGEYLPAPDGRAWQLDPARPEHLRRLFADLGAGGLPPCRGIVHLWSLDAPATEGLTAEAALAAQMAGPVALLHTLQALDQAGWREKPRLWVVTRGAQETGAGDGAVAVAQAPIWGFARTVFHQENVELAGGIVDLDPAAPQGEVDRLLDVIRHPAGEDQLALREGAVLVPRMVPAPRLAEGFLRPRIRPDGCYLITGGLGGLGLLFARWLVERGARRLVLTGRTALPPRSEWGTLAPGTPAAGRVAAVRELESLGASVRVAAFDAADGEALDELLADLRRDGWAPVRGVLHAAGVSRPQLLLQMSAEELTSALRPKLAGGWLLHDRLRDEPLDFFVLFSSVAGLGFSMGMTDYAAGNAFLDGLAAFRRSLGLAANSIDWGSWGEVGMASPEEVATAFMQRGFLLISPEQGLQAMERIFEHDPGQAVVLAADWSQMPQRNYPMGPPVLLRALAVRPQEEEPASRGLAPVGLRERLAAAEPAGREVILAAHLGELAARVLRLDPSRLDLASSLSVLGLDSMMAVELRNRVEKSLGAGPSVVELLQGASVADLAGLLLPRLDLLPKEAAELPVLPAAGEGGAFPLSYGQQALWFLHQREPESTAYNVAFAGRVRSEVDEAALRKAFQWLVDRHPALRTRYGLEQGRPVQRVEPEHEVAFEACAAAGPSEAELHLQVEEAYGRPFDLERGPLMRVHLFTRSRTEHILLLVAHHIAVDGWSLFLLLDELRSLYAAARSGALRPPLPPPAASVVDHMRWQQELLAGPKGERLWAYWSQQLTPPPPPLELPIDRPRPRLQTFRGATHTFVFDGETTVRLRELARAEGATLFMSLMAVLQAFLYRVSGQSEFAVGSATAGRDRSELNDVVGHFVNSVVLRADLSASPSLRELLRQVRQTTLSAFEHQEYPFPLLVERLQAGWDPSRSPLFQVSLVLQNLPGLGQMPEFLIDTPGESAEADLGGLLVEPYPLAQQAGQHELELEVYERPGSLLAVLQYNTDLFDPSTIEVLAGRMATFAANTTSQPDVRVDDLEIVSETERRERAAENARRHENDLSRLRASRRRGIQLAVHSEEVKVTIDGGDAV